MRLAVLNAPRHLDGLGADVTFEVTGVQAGLIAAGEATRMSGKLVITGYHQGEPRAIPLAAVDEAFAVAASRPPGFVEATVSTTMED